ALAALAALAPFAFSRRYAKREVGLWTIRGPGKRLLSDTWLRADGQCAQELEHQIRRQHRRNLAGTVVERRHFDDVAADEREAGESSHQALRFVARQAAHFRRPGSGRKGRIDAVDVKRHV